MAAGASSRFAPLSFEQHKAMTVVKGEILIERQIRQLLAAGVPEVIVVTGYQAEQFTWLREKYGVRLIHNSDYQTRNNNGSVWAARALLGNSYLCSADNYFSTNPFQSEVEESYYAAEYAHGPTAEWCMTEDAKGYINSVTVGGENAWYMLGHTFWSRDFARRFLSILEHEYHREETRGKLWESIFASHLDVLKMKIRRYAPGVIYEFDTLDELRDFDTSYRRDTRSGILKAIARQLGISEEDMVHISARKGERAQAEGFSFDCPRGHYSYLYATGKLEKA